MKGFLILVLLLVVVGGGMKMAGMRVPILDYPVGPMGDLQRGPAVPDVQIEPPGFGDFGAP